MVRRTFSTRPAYAQSIQGLLRLHALTVSGKDDSPEAEIVRASLERPWTDLSEIEKNRISGLSEDLFSISEEPSEPLPTNPQAQRKLLEAIEARQSGDWDKALELLRRWGKYLDSAVLSFLRGSVWQSAGDSETATPFYQHAADLDPSDDKFLCMYLFSLQTSDPALAIARAQKIISNDGSYQPVVVAQAANIVAASTRGLAAMDARPVLQQLARVLERTLQRLKNAEAAHFTAFESTHANLTTLLGFCYERIGDSRAALASYNLGLLIGPKNDALLVARGTLRYGVDRLAAEDFKLAIQCGSTLVWPYFFLAHDLLVSNRFDECRRMCERALDFVASDEVRASLNEWLAISEAELGFPRALVRSAFEEAIRLGPDVERIRRNLDEFDRAMTNGTNGTPSWVRPSGSVVQEVGRAEYFPVSAVGSPTAA
jgi:tetratricopeptide (TPR) repeat protein